MARDATARLYDVDEDKVTLNIPLGIITFQAKKGRLVSLDKLHESIWATRLSGGTGMHLNWMEVTAEGTISQEEGKAVLKVSGSTARFVLAEGGTSSRGRTPLERLKEHDAKGTVRVTGRLDGWSGHFPPFLNSPPKEPRRILVKNFKVVERSGDRK